MLDAPAPTATERVRAAAAAGRELIERKEVKLALRERGMSARQVDALLRGGWKALVGESKAEAEELRDTLAELTTRLRA